MYRDTSLLKKPLLSHQAAGANSKQINYSLQEVRVLFAIHRSIGNGVRRVSSRWEREISISFVQERLSLKW